MSEDKPHEYHSVRLIGDNVPYSETVKELQRILGLSAMESLKEAERLGYLDFSRISRILDFGSGLGGPTTGIIDYVRGRNIHVDAVEIGELWVKVMIQTGILPQENIIQGDGVEYLQSLRSKVSPPYNLVTAFSLGPDHLGRIFRNLALACQQGLSENGSLLVTSDPTSIEAALNVCKQAEVPYHFIDEEKIGEKQIRRATLVVPKSSCEKITPPKLPFV